MEDRKIEKYFCRLCASEEPQAFRNESTSICIAAYETLWAENERLQKEIENLQLRNRLRPISEIHEDYGPCACIDLAGDPGYMEIHWSSESDFDESQWTHFVPMPALLTKDAERLLTEQPPAGERE